MKRKQLKRGVLDWRMLPNSRSVARPSRWGNLYRIQRGGFSGDWIVVNAWSIFHAPMGKSWSRENAAQKAVELYRTYAIDRLKREPDWLDPLRGLDYIYCWCEEDAPWCHGDVLIELMEER